MNNLTLTVVVSLASDSLPTTTTSAPTTTTPRPSSSKAVSADHIPGALWAMMAILLVFLCVLGGWALYHWVCKPKSHEGSPDESDINGRGSGSGRRLGGSSQRPSTHPLVTMNQSVSTNPGLSTDPGPSTASANPVDRTDSVVAFVNSAVPGNARHAVHGIKEGVNVIMNAGES